MFLNELTLRNFRNYESLCLPLWPGVMLFYGKNAQGKTNLLEALHYASTLTSIRAEKEKDLVRFGNDAFFLRLSLQDEKAQGEEGKTAHKIFEVEVYTKPSLKKRVFLDGKSMTRKEAKGILPAVFFGPDDLFMIKGPSSTRRHFLDSLLSRVDRVYEEELSKYHDVLQRRNTLLKKASAEPVWRRTFDSLSELLISLGTSLLTKRARFINSFSPLVKEFYYYLCGRDCEMEYWSCVGIDDIENQETSAISRSFRKKLASLEDAEKARGMTLSGPHRDDLLFSKDGRSFRYYGSQGEQRSLVLALKLAEGRFYEDCFNRKPVFLLDDVLSELDRQRRQKLLSSLDPSYQIFITSTDILQITDGFFHAYEVEGNTVSPVKES